MKNNREQIEKIVEYAGKRKINLPADLLLSIAKSDAQELVDTLEKVPEFWEADKITGIISPAHLPLYTKKTPGIVPPPKEDGLVLMSDGWHFPPVVTNITSVTGGTRGGGGGGVTDHALLTNLAYATSGHTGFQPTLAFPLVPNLGGTGVANLAASTLTLGAATTITGGGVIGLGGFTGTVSITGTFAMGAGTLTAVTVNDVTVAAHTHAITGFQPTMTFPLAANLGGTGVANLVASTLTLGAATSITGGGTLALGGFTLTVPATGTTVVNSGVVAGQLVKGVTDTNHITAAAIIPPASNILTLTNAAASTLALAITAGKTLTLTATDNYTLTVPATGTAALLATANVFTANQTISNTAPSLALTDTTAAAKSLTIAVDANVVDLRESAGASGSLLVLDLTNSRVGIGTTGPLHALDITQTQNQRTAYGLNVSETASTLQSDVASTGNDETLTNQYYAWSFTASASHTVGSWAVRLKKVGTVTNTTDYIRLKIYSDTPGAPNTLLATTDNIKMGSLTTSYVSYLFGIDLTLVNGTTYWIAVERSAAVTGGGSIAVDRNATALTFATVAVPTSGDWTVLAGLGRYILYGQSPKAIYGNSTNSMGVQGISTNSYGVQGISTNSIGVYGISTNNIGVYGNSTNNYGVYGNSTNSVGVYGNSTNSIGVQGNSTNSYGVYGNSTNNYGVYGISTNSYGGIFYQSGTLTTANATNTVLIRRYGVTNTTGSLNYSGNVLQITDNPTGTGTVTGSLINGSIDGTVILNFNPRVADGASAVAYMIDTKNTLSNATAQLFAIRNGGADKFTVLGNGNVGIGGQLSIVGSADSIQLQVKANATQTTNLFTCETSAAAVLHSVSGTGITSILSTVAGALVIGAGTAGIDYNITFDGETNNGVITWMEDEDYFQFGDDIYLPGGENIVLGTATGTKIGTATSQLLGFYNATPVDQPATVADPSGGLVIDTEARAALVSVIDRLQELGLVA